MRLFCRVLLTAVFLVVGTLTGYARTDMAKVTCGAFLAWGEFPCGEHRRRWDLLIVPVAQLGLRHLHRALVVRDHHRGEILIHVAGGLDFHAGHHPRHRADIFGKEP